MIKTFFDPKTLQRSLDKTSVDIAKPRVLKHQDRKNDKVPTQDTKIS